MKDYILYHPKRDKIHHYPFNLNILLIVRCIPTLEILRSEKKVSLELRKSCIL